MIASGTGIGCGIYQLASLGNDPRQEDFNREIARVNPTHAILLASLTDQQKKTIAFIERNGFRQISKWKRNPNSGNMVAVWMRYKDIRTCQECGWCSDQE